MRLLHDVRLALWIVRSSSCTETQSQFDVRFVRRSRFAAGDEVFLALCHGCFDFQARGTWRLGFIYA